MRIIITNDDGIDAPGINALYEALKDSCEIIVAAPKDQQSAVSHKVNTDMPIQVEQIKKGFFSIAGTPADCVRIATTTIAPNVSWIVSGINNGANLGTDVYVSGTVAAAREAVFLGYKSLSISQYVAKDYEVDWDIVSYHASWIIKEVMQWDLKNGCFWNINLPHPMYKDILPCIKQCDVDKTPYEFVYKETEKGLKYISDFHMRARSQGMDIDTCFSGNISISCLSI